MKNKQEIRRFLEAHFSHSEECATSINRRDFERLLNHPNPCLLITLTAPMPTLIQQFRVELKAVDISPVHNMVLHITHHPTVVMDYQTIEELLTNLHDFAPEADIVWGCEADAQLEKVLILALFS